MAPGLVLAASLPEAAQRRPGGPAPPPRGQADSALQKSAASGGSPFSSCTPWYALRFPNKRRRGVSGIIDREGGGEPVRTFLKSLKRRDDRAKKVAVTTAIERVLKIYGTDVCLTEWGKNLGRGLNEFRIRHTAEEIEKARRLVIRAKAMARG
jgi:hypothetical protein